MIENTFNSTLTIIFHRKKLKQNTTKTVPNYPTKFKTMTFFTFFKKKIYGKNEIEIIFVFLCSWQHTLLKKNNKKNLIMLYLTFWNKCFGAKNKRKK